MTETMTKLEIFEKVRAHLLKQGAQSRGGVGFCAYRGNHGMKCALGCLIKDEFYNEQLEGRNISYGYVREALTLSVGPLSEGSFKMLADLQKIHDQIPVNRWEDCLRIIRRKIEVGEYD